MGSPTEKRDPPFPGRGGRVPCPKRCQSCKHRPENALRLGELAEIPDANSSGFEGGGGEPRRWLGGFPLDRSGFGEGHPETTFSPLVRLLKGGVGMMGPTQKTLLALPQSHSLQIRGEFLAVRIGSAKLVATWRPGSLALAATRSVPYLRPLSNRFSYGATILFLAEQFSVGK